MSSPAFASAVRVRKYTMAVFRMPHVMFMRCIDNNAKSIIRWRGGTQPRTPGLLSPPSHWPSTHQPTIPSEVHYSAASTASCGRLRNSLADLVTALLLREHDLEAREVVEGAALRDRGTLLRPAGCLPLRDGALLLELLADHAAARGARQLRQDEGSKREVAVAERLPGDTSRGAVNDCLCAKRPRSGLRASGQKPGGVPGCGR